MISYKLLFKILFILIFISNLVGCGEDNLVVKSLSIREPRPLMIHYVSFNPSQFDLKLGLTAKEDLSGESVLSMVHRTKAIAGISGGYLLGNQFGGEGIPLFALKKDGIWVSSNGAGGPQRYKLDRQPTGAIGFSQDGKVYFGNIQAEFEVLLGGWPIPINNLNKPREPNEIVLYNNALTERPKARGKGIELVIDELGKVIKEEINLTESIQPPSKGWALSIGEDSPHYNNLLARKEKLFQVRPVINSFDLNGSKITPSRDWNQFENILAAGPILIENGELVSREKYPQGFFNFNVDFFDKLHPRGGICVDNSGNIKLIAIDGRKPGVSEGVTTFEFAKIMKELLDCQYGMNLDGGGSTTLVMQDAILNSPSGDLGSEASSGPVKIRNIATSILICPKTKLRN